MESAQAPLTTRYIVYSYIDDVFALDGQNYIHIRGSRESIALGTEPLTFAAGDRVKITFEKVELNAKQNG